MKKLVITILSILFIIPFNVFATRGCCSSHGGVCGCSKTGVQMCCDGTGSPTCRCTPPAVYGCTDYKANNYNADANTDDGSCTYTVRGCTDSNANNYNPEANQDDGSCKYDVYGCTDYKAKNYNYKANKDDGSCEYETEEKRGSSKANYEIEVEDTNTEEESDDSPADGILGLLTLIGIAGGVGYAKTKKKK